MELNERMALAIIIFYIGCIIVISSYISPFDLHDFDPILWLIGAAFGISGTLLMLMEGTKQNSKEKTP